MRVSHTAIPSQAPSASEADTTQALSHTCSSHHQDGTPAFSGPTDFMTELQQRQRPGRRHCHDVQTAEKYTDRDTGRSRRLVSSTNRWLRHRLPRASLVFSSVILIFWAALCAQPVEAAQINFENCLPDNYRYNNNPVLLQFVPLYVDAVFDTENPTHSLRVTAYGNVTGTNTNEPLPAWNSSDWRDPKMTLGKILRDPNPNGPDPKLTTLHSKVNVLTYEPWNGDFDFCNTALVNASCPLGPVFNTTVLAPYQLPSFNLTQNFYSSYAFTSFSATFLIKYGDAGTDIGCVSATITPDLGDLVWMLKILPVVILLVVGFATIFAAVFSPWGSTDIFHWSSNYGRDADILRLVTPGFGDCLGYIQFIVLTGGLTLNYPGFFQPIVSQAAWSALMFNETFVSKAPGLTSLVDGIYVTNGQYGLQHIAQLVGMEEAEDVWAGMMVWLLVIIAGTFVVCQLGFGLQWVYRFIRHIPEEDLRAKNVPFSVGNVIRIAFNYFLLPLVALSTFQLVLAGSSPAYTVALAAITVVVLLGFAIWLLYLIVSTKPRAVLFDDLPTVLLYGPLYNTYSDEAAAFAMIPLLLTFVRGIAIGGVQPSGVAQVVILAICEVVQILTIHAFRPFHTKSSMNAYHTLFASLRIASVLLMIAFVPQLGVTEGARGWVGYVILVIHAGVLILGFLLNAIQTILEVVARLLGAGNDDIRGQTRGGLSKIFGMRQLSRRMPRRNAGPSRQSNLSTTAMLDEEASKTGYVMPSGRVRSESAGSIGVLLNNRGKRSSSALDFTSVDVPFAPRILDSGASSFTPTTPGEISTFSFLPSPGGANRNSMPPASAAALEAGDPFYRQPRRTRRQTIDTRDTTASPADKTRGSWASADWSVKRNSQPGASLMPEITTEAEPPVSRAATPAPAAAQPAISFAPRADYSTREVDFYYGVRGERLNSDAPSRKLGTGPADPTGPMASAAGWFKTFLGGKTKEKGKGFEVVRSSRMPPAMKARGGDFAEDGPPEGIPVAMGVLRNGPIESDDEDEAKRKKAEKAARLGRANGEAGSTELLDEDGNPQEDNGDEVEMSRIPDAPPMLPGIDIGEEIRLPSRIQSKSSRYTAHTAARDIGDDDIPDVPEVPRKSSRRTPTHSRGPSLNLDTHFESPGGVYGQHLAPGAGGSSSRLPFERTGSQKRLSSGSSLGATTTEEMSQIDLHDSSDGGGGGGNGVGQERRPASFGHVQQGSVNRIDPDHRGQVNLHGTSAEVVDEHERK